ncbi:N-acetylmuramidase family protein [Pleomorphovibrio marinus]|uniref:N-acetylmuramidase family protein n=1 Tax=Pleomorphovibrio marinus TaxID=2164132 RepID=UPI000E0C467E|nr:N-acetylmuramidase domain-containing protein [Pleomorphovibrio marinus]
MEAKSKKPKDSPPDSIEAKETQTFSAEEEKDRNEQIAKDQKEKQRQKYLYVKIGGILLGTLILLFGLVPTFDSANRGFGAAVFLLIAVALLYTAIARHVSPVVKTRTPNNNPSHHVFFKGTVVLTVLLTIIGFLGSFFVYLEHGNVFQAVGLATSVIWISVFLVYFMWSVYHYNINYGITDEDWNRIDAARKRYIAGEPVEESELIAPKYNPYRSQTFGLPTGTVRGMIAFTLLLGGMSLLITSFGSSYSGGELALIRQQFEFFETAFLMMIAFYFGDRSLKYLKGRWTDPNAKKDTGRETTLQGKILGDSSPGKVAEMDNLELNQIDSDDRYFMEEDKEFRFANTPLSLPASSPDERRKILSRSVENPVGTAEGEGFVQINDNTHSKVLSDMDMRLALEELAEEEGLRLSLPVVKAVVTVETGNGRGHLKDGRAKILFEGHKFWKWLEKDKLNPEDYLIGNEDILYKNWTRDHYKGGAAEYERLEKAKIINPKAAIYSASWGLFQILGENIEHNIKGRGYKNAADFEEKQQLSEKYHFLDFLEFIKTKEVRKKALIHYISEENKGKYDWEAFAYGYNGPSYAVNRYHEKMQQAYERIKNEMS